MRSRPGRKRFGLSLAGFLWGGAALLHGGEQVLLEPGAYAARAEREIDAATESVHLYLYLFNIQRERDTPPRRLLTALLRAVQRGVRVEALLDSGNNPFDTQDRNLAAYEALDRGGASAAYVDGRILHAKILIVDKKTVLLGSSNWTTSAFERNVEADVLFRSTAAARALVDRMSAVPRKSPPRGPPGGRVLVPEDFLAPGKLGEMERRQDEGSLDLYLHFLRVGMSTSAFSPLDVPAAVAAMGNPDRGPVANRRRLHKVFRRLKEVYGLAEAEETYGKDPRARLLPAASTGTVAVPAAYFAWGWDRRLTPSGKTFYLLDRYHADRSPASPRWCLSQKRLAEEHGLQTWTISTGLTDLRRKNLIEVDYDEQPTPEDPRRRPSVYWASPLYDPAVLEKRLETLRRKDPAAYARAADTARLLYEDSNDDIIESLMELETRYGRALMAEAVALLRRMKPDNPKRTFGYLVGIVNGLAGPDYNAPPPGP